MPATRTKTPIQKELERFAKLTAIQKTDVQSNIWTRPKAEIVADLEKFKYVGDAFYAKPAGGWAKLTAGGLKAMLNRMYKLPFPAKGVSSVSLDSAKFVVHDWWLSGGNFPKPKAKSAAGIWAALEAMRARVDPVSGDLTTAEVEVRRLNAALGGGGGAPTGGAGGGSGAAGGTGGAPTGGAGGGSGAAGGAGGALAGGHTLPPPTRTVSFATGTKSGTKRSHDGNLDPFPPREETMTWDQLCALRSEREVTNMYAVPTRVWYDNDTSKIPQLRSDFEMKRRENQELCLTVVGGWKLLINWPVTAEIGYGAPAENLHFDTATARELFADPNGSFEKFDQDGLRQMATRAGRNGAAEAFLDKLWSTLAGRLTSGATATCFLQYALDILAGATSEPPQPDLVAGLFQQLHAAGTRTQDKLPCGSDQVPTAMGYGVKSVALLPESARRELVDAQRRVVSDGTPDSVLDMVASAISGSAGITLSDKHASYIKSCCQSLSSNKALQAFGESSDGTGIVIKTTDNTSTFHVSMQIQCVFACADTRGNAPCLKTNLDEVKSTCQAITGRQFSSTKFKFLNLLPNVTRPADAVLLKALKEVNDGMLDGSYDAYQSQAQDTVVYPWLRMGLVTMAVTESPNFDAGFISMLRTISDGILRWSVSGAPLSSVVKIVAKFMMQAENEANQRTALAGRTSAATTSGGFRPSNDILVDLAQLDSFTRGQAVSANLLFRRQCEEFGVTVPGAKPASSRGNPGSTADSIQKAVDRAVSAATKRRRDNNGGGGGGGGGKGQGGGKGNKRQRKRGGKATQQANAQDDSDSGSDDEFKRRGTGTAPQDKSQKKSGAGKSTNQLRNRMNINEWKTKYGSKTVNGKEVMLCWFHLHKDKGCVLPDGKECFHSHDHFPDDYGGKVFADLSQAEQERISDSVVKG